MRSWRPWASATTSPTAWRASRTVAGCCWWPGWTAARWATGPCRGSRPTTRQFGHDRLILAVGVDNPNARRLYERLGYVDWDHGTVVGTWVERDHHGSPTTLSETCHVLVKRL
jgi:hypothetical protein